MPSIKIKNFKYGLDSRRSELESQPGTLAALENAHVNQGGEVEKRKAFVFEAFPAGTFGAQPTAAGIVTFGSTAPGGITLPTISGLTLLYQQLVHPDGSTAMTSVPFSECFAGKAFAVATFADGKKFPYYDGVLVNDFTDGRILAHLNTNALIAEHIKSIVNDSSAYSAELFTVPTESRARATNVATIVTDLPHGLSTGQRVTLAGLGGTGYNATNVQVTVTNITTFTYASVGGDEGTTADGGGTVTALETLLIEGAVGVDFSLNESENSVSGDLSTPTVTQEEIPFKEGVSSMAAFRIITGTESAASAAAATGTITKSATNPSNGNTVTVGGKRYTFKTTPTLDGDVDIGANAAASLANLKAAINYEAGAGTTYIGFAPHTLVTASAISGDNLPLTAAAGSSGNSIALATTVSGWSVSAADMAGGAGNCVASIKVIAPDQTAVELLGSAVDFDSTAEVTATAVAQEINDNTLAGLTHGFTAVATDNSISIFSALDENPMPNKYVLQVTASGDVCIGDCMFYFVQLSAAGFTITSIKVNGVQVLGSTAFPQVGTVDSFSELYAYIAGQINAESGTHGIVAKASTDFIQISKAVTRSDDLALPVTVAFAAGNTGAVVFGPPPSAPTPLSFVTSAGGGRNGGEFNDVPTKGDSSESPNFFGVEILAVEITGGIPPYSYDWREETFKSNESPARGGTGITTNPNANNWYVYSAPSNAPFTRFHMVHYPLAFGTSRAGMYTTRWVCEVTDSVGNKVISDAFVVNLAIVYQ